MTIDNVPPAARAAAKQIAEPRPMRRGSLTARYMKCGKPACGCHEDPEGRHGPYYSLTRVKGGKTRSRYLDAAQAPIARAQVEAGQAFRRSIEAYWEACEEWGDQELEKAEAASNAEVAKKGASKKLSRRKSSRRSKRL